MELEEDIKDKTLDELEPYYEEDISNVKQGITHQAEMFDSLSEASIVVAMLLREYADGTITVGEVAERVDELEETFDDDPFYYFDIAFPDVVGNSK